MQQGGTTTSLHLHADAANTAAHASTNTSEYVSVPIDLRRLDQATAGPPSSMGVRSVVVTMSPNSERLARDSTSDDVEIAAGHRPFSTGQAVLDNNVDPSSSTSDKAGTNRFANRFNSNEREVGDNYCAGPDLPVDSEKFGILCNLGAPYRSDTGHKSDAIIRKFEYGTSYSKSLYVLGLPGQLGWFDTHSPYRAYNHAVADGQQVQFDAFNGQGGATIAPFRLPQGVADANKVTPDKQSSRGTETALLYARNVVIPTHVTGQGAKGERALMFFNTYADATADEVMASKAVDIGPTGFSDTIRSLMESTTLLTSATPLNADYGAEESQYAFGHVLTIQNRSVLELQANWFDTTDDDDDGVIELQYVGSHPPDGAAVPQPTFFAKRIDGTDTTGGLGQASPFGFSAQARVVLFKTEAEARKKLSDYYVDTDVAHEGAATHARALAYACAKAAVRLVQPAMERAQAEATRRHAFADPLYKSARLMAQLQSLNHIDPSDASGATLIKLKRPTKLRGGDEVVFEPVLEGDSGRNGGPQYEFGSQSTGYTHTLDPAPDGETQYAAYTGAAIVGQPIAEGAVAYVGGEVDDDNEHRQIRLYTSREAALAQDHSLGASLNAFRAYSAARSTGYYGDDYTLLGRLRIVRRRASSTWTCLYAEIGGCSAGSAGVISTDPYVSQTGHHVVAVPRSLANRLYPVDITLPIDAVDRRGHLKLWVVEHDGKRRRPVFPDDLERIDVLVDIHHRRKPLSEAERKQRYQAFVAEVVSSWGGGGDPAAAGQALLEPFQGPGSGRRAF